MDKTETIDILTEHGKLRATIADATATGSYIDSFAELDHQFGVPKDKTAFTTLVLDKELPRYVYMNHNGMPERVEVEVETDAGVLVRYENALVTQPGMYVKDQRGYEYEFAAPTWDVESPFD